MKSSGIISAIGGNGVGISSVNPDPSKYTIFVAKALKKDGTGTTAGLIKAVERCVNVGAKVVSISLGCYDCYSQVRFHNAITANRST